MTTRPVARLKEVHYRPTLPDGSYGETMLGYKAVEVWCQGCEYLHHFTVEVVPGYPKRADGSDQPVWSWNGSLESPTFEPSLLCYYTVHLCAEQHIYTECTDTGFEHCGHQSHGYAWVFEDGHMRTFKTYETQPADVVKTITFGGGATDHPLDPAFGNCHTFLRNGVWDYLGDCGHALRGPHPLLPIPGWFFHDGDDA